MTTNVQISTSAYTKLTGLTDDKTYSLQGKCLCYGDKGSKMQVCEIEVVLSDTEPSEDLIGQTAEDFKFVKPEDVDIYVRATQADSIVVVTGGY